jgi:lysophospholipase L1-like esterase
MPFKPSFSCIALLISGSALAQQRTLTIVMLGDSTTLCARNPAGKKLPELVQEGLQSAFKNKDTTIKVINSGVGSDTAKGGLARLAGAVLDHKPDLVTISFGLNDTGVSTPEEFEKSLREMIERIRKDTKAKVMLVTSTPFDNKRHGWGAQYATKGGLDEYMDARYCARMRVLSKELKTSLGDLHTDFKTAIKKDPKLLGKTIMDDGVHLSDDGNVLAAKLLVPKIVEAVQGQ